jgi:exosome complex exonuclease RRP6
VRVLNRIVFDYIDKTSRPLHPYRYEINNLTYPDHMFQSQPPIPFKPSEETPLTLVSTSAQLVALIDKLRESKEIAIDLEYHSYRAYTGFVCLMQISTRDEDWIVDPFELRDELEDLNEVFTNPNIVKARPILLTPEPTLTHHRSCTAPIVTSFGFSKTSIYIS